MNLRISNLNASVDRLDYKTKELKDINLEFAQDKIYLVTGENGAGKSALLEAIALLNNVNSGTITFNKLEVNINKGRIDKEIKKDYISNIRNLFQENRLHFFHNTVAEDLIYGHTDKEKVLKKAKKYLKDFELPLDTLDKNYTVLSGGELKKVAIIDILLTNPNVIVLDDILTGLSSHSTELVLSALLKVKKKKIIIVSSNKEIKDKTYIDEEIIMQKGQIKEVKKSNSKKEVKKKVKKEA